MFEQSIYRPLLMKYQTVFLLITFIMVANELDKIGYF